MTGKYYTNYNSFDTREHLTWTLQRCSRQQTFFLADGFLEFHGRFILAIDSIASIPLSLILEKQIYFLPAFTVSFYCSILSRVGNFLSHGFLAFHWLFMPVLNNISTILCGVVRKKQITIIFLMHLGLRSRKAQNRKIKINR